MHQLWGLHSPSVTDVLESFSWELATQSPSTPPQAPVRLIAA